MKQSWGTVTRSIETFKAKDNAKAFNIKRNVATLDTTVIRQGLVLRHVASSLEGAARTSALERPMRRTLWHRELITWRRMPNTPRALVPTCSPLDFPCRSRPAPKRVWSSLSLACTTSVLFPVERACCTLECLLLESLSVGHGKKPKNSCWVRDCPQVSTMNGFFT